MIVVENRESIQRLLVVVHAFVVDEQYIVYVVVFEYRQVLAEHFVVYN